MLQVDENEVVIVLDTNYVLQLNHILQSTPKRTIANYFGWRAIYFGSDLLNNVLHEQEEQYLAKTTGMQRPVTRETECIKKTMS